MKKVLHLISLFLLIIQFQFCSDQPDTVHWPKNDTNLSAIKYRLNIADTANILINKDNLYTFIEPHDSLITSQFKIKYFAIAEERQKYFSEANQKVTNTLNPNVTEYYKFEKGKVFLLGYSTNNELKPFTIFEPPLVISNSDILTNSTTSGTMKTFNTETNSFDEGFNATLKIIKPKEIALDAGTELDTKYYLRELVMARDATVGFGENNLIMPEAIMFRSKIITDNNGLPIAEWSIKSENLKSEKQPELEHETNLQQHKLHIELTKYKLKHNNR